MQRNCLSQQYLRLMFCLTEGEGLQNNRVVCTYGLGVLRHQWEEFQGAS